MMRGKHIVIALGMALPALAAAADVLDTKQNLLVAYNQEVNARLRYQAFAEKADKEGFPGAAGLFRALAFSEGVHADNHARALETLGGRAVQSVLVYRVAETRANLKESLKVEKSESGTIYPAYLRQAAVDGNAQAVKSLEGAMASEGGHARLLTKVLRRAGEWKTKLVILVCKACGYTTDDLSVKACPYCAHPRAEFAEL